MDSNILMDLEIANGHGECVVCFEALFMKGPSVLASSAPRRGFLGMGSKPLKRVCRHFLCSECAGGIMPKTCPVCRRAFEMVLDVPDPLRDPQTWFEVVDWDQSGTIEKQELIDALKAMFPVEPGMLEEAIHSNWSRWDTDCNQRIDAREFRKELAPFLSATIGNMRARVNNASPDLRSSPAEWFRFWDEDKSGTLERPEIVRALVKSIPGLSGGDEEWLSGVFGVIWSLIDPNNDGSITEAEFVAPGGLYETLVANMYRDGGSRATS